MSPTLTNSKATAISGEFILDIDAICEDNFAIADLKAWLDAMSIRKRTVTTHRYRYSDEVIAYWLAHGFSVEIRNAANDNVAKSVLDRAA